MLEKYGYLTPIGEIFYVGNRKAIKCKCDCGIEKIILLKHLQTNTKSCGCLRKKLVSERSIIHNDYKTYEYRKWLNIKQLCDNPKNNRYKDYGGRGIDYDIRFENDYKIFKQDLIDTIGLRPNSKYSLDRINNNKGYYKNNWKWSTSSEQQFNRRNCK
jgi:hypothetical protein